jgi:hypothetical protein
MKVLFLIRGGNVPADQQEASMVEWKVYMEELQKRGVLRGGLPLAGGKVVSSNGVEDYKASEGDVSGHMELEVGSLDDAVNAAKMAPNVKHSGTVEVRQAMDMPGM